MVAFYLTVSPVGVEQTVRQISPWWGGRGGKYAKQTETWHNLQSPSSTDEHRENLPGDHRRLRWNGKQDLTFLLLLEPSSLEPARLKVRTAKRSEKAITAAVQIQRPSPGRELQYQSNQEENKGKYCPPLWDTGTSVFQKVHGFLCFMQQ